MSMTGGTTPSAGPTPPAPAPAAKEKSSKKFVIGGIVAVLALGAAAVGFVFLGSDDAGAEEVLLEPLDTTGENPFTEAVGEDVPVEPAEVPPTDAAAVQIDGDTVGLYGGTDEDGRCDPAQLVTFLQQNPDKAAAWASVHGITPDQIPDFVAGLTPLVLRSDTAVTNHGFRDGSAYSLQSVLQAGTAVLVNDKGEPVVKCGCGNPLLAPESSGTPEYTGTRWPDFNPRAIVVIQASSTTINTFQVFNLTTNTITRVPAGSSNIPGTPGTPPVPPTIPGTTTPPTTTTPSINGRYNMTITNVVCEINGGTCPPTEQVTIEINCSGSTCDIGGDPYTLNGNTLTSDQYNPPTCDGVPVQGGTATTTLTIDAAGNLTGGRIINSPAVPPSCPNPFVQEWTYSGSRA